MNQPYIKMSSSIFSSLLALKKFNYQNIYQPSTTKEELSFYKEGMNRLFQRYLLDVDEEHQDSVIYELFLNNQCREYLENTSNKRKVIDFIAGMTDDFFLREIQKQ